MINTFYQALTGLPGTILGTKDVKMNKANKSPCPHRAYIFLEGEKLTQ